VLLVDHLVEAIQYQRRSDRCTLSSLRPLLDPFLAHI
jgi:hypothetical protein